MEFMSQFDMKIVYIKGEDNTIADALSCLLTVMAADIVAAAELAHRPYDFCVDDDISVNAVLPTKGDSPLFCAHALVETDIATTQAVTAVLSIVNDPHLHDEIKMGYLDDKWCKKLLAAVLGMPSVQEHGGLLFIEDHLVIPATGSIPRVSVQTGT